MTTLRFPLSRIEGHARVEMEVEDGKVVSAQFQAIEMRGFRYFMQGTPAEQMPVIVPRICGVCSTAHHVASVKALEDIFEVEPPELAKEIRELLLLGQLIQNQATSLFIFTMPDRVGASSIFHMDESEADPDQQLSLAQRALKVRQIMENTAGAHTVSKSAANWHEADHLGRWAVHSSCQSNYWRGNQRDQKGRCGKNAF